MLDKIIKGVIASCIVFLFMFFSTPFISHDKEKKYTIPQIKTGFYKMIAKALSIITIPQKIISVYIKEITEGEVKCQLAKDFI